MNLSRARILQAQRTAIQTTLAKIPYYKFSYVLKPLESLVKRYTYIKHTHQIQGVCFTYVPTTIYEDAPFHHKLISTGQNLFNFCQIDVLIFISLITGNIMPISFFFFFLPIIGSQLESLSTFALRWLLPNPGSLAQSKAGRHQLCCVDELRIGLAPEQ